MNQYQTLPGKRSKRSELNGNREGDGEYLSPVQLSPTHSQNQDYSLSEFGQQAVANAYHHFKIVCRFWDHV